VGTSIGGLASGIFVLYRTAMLVNKEIKEQEQLLINKENKELEQSS